MARRINISRQTLTVLSAFLETPQGWRYGYDLIKETGLKSGTLYPLLMRLHDQGLLDSEWHPSPQQGRPARHAYRLSHAGIALAKQARSSETPPLQSAVEAFA
ncbi:MULTISPECIES: PadR family transcriptional regulator [Bacteria][Archaea]|jgi:DNA-binding PadR family transcriptional regulator|uniref:PadR family transcriptional regulator n=1 Tax=Bacteria TaxID=2 RepID=UPI001AC04914|nr:MULTISPECIES: PadR family transcriptional regulator [unclassified Sphingopyxis]MBN8841700.1 PadR family transcriptional regulator [Sphingomonadales bacterium]MDR6834180.1 DNA-binding PadR family transcriptional regulator [Sphingopyxis sp. BE122]MDR7226450.1 DNA-binding PadR family transcriptional regulator [Sphingopyxis sp. BE259]HEV7311896.1 PadR family transcriptional regulator [Sphingopyxis sp.]